MRAAPADGDFFEARAAAATGLPFAVIDVEMLLMMALATLTVAVIAERRTAVPEAFAQDLLHRCLQSLIFFARQAHGRTRGINPREKQRFIGIDIADARDAPLVEQKDLMG